MHDRDFSDHSILEIHLEAPLSMEIGPGVWRLNNKILDKNHKVISEIIGSVLKLNISYDGKNQLLRDSLRSISINRNRVRGAYRQRLLQAIKENVQTSSKAKEATQQLIELENEECGELLRTIKNSMLETYEGNPREVKKWANKRHPSTVISELKRSDGTVSTDSHVNLEEFASFYKSLYSDEEMDCSKRFDVLRKISKKILLDSANALDEEITLIEIQAAIKKLKKNTSPGPDGLSSELYQRHDMLFTQLLQPVFAEAWEGGKLPKSFPNATIKI